MPFIPTENPNIFRKTQDPNHDDFVDWFYSRLGKRSEKFIGEYGMLQSLETRYKNAKGEMKMELDGRIRKTNQRIQVMEGIINKGGVMKTSSPNFKDFDHNETAVYELLYRLFLLEWYCGKWGDPKRSYLVQYTLFYARIKHYERKAKNYTHGRIAREASLRAKSILTA